MTHDNRHRDIGRDIHQRSSGRASHYRIQSPVWLIAAIILIVVGAVTAIGSIIVD